MFVYIDESGNTGQNIGDKNHPIFYHLALFSKYNLDLDLNGSLKNFLKSRNKKELHAAESPGLLEDASSIILKILEENNAYFYYAEIDKSYLAFAKLFDSLFDNEENIGARRSIYQFRYLRLMLFWNFISILDDDVAFLFYKNCLMANSLIQAKEYLKAVCKRILSEIYKLRDARSRQIIEDAVNGAKFCNDEISLFEKEKQNRWRHLPHIVSFVPMLSAISRYSKKNKLKVHKIIHDEQEQIQRLLIDIYKNSAEYGLKGIPLNLRENGSLDFTRIPENCFEIKDSKTSFGTQITDVCLYILTHEMSNFNFSPNRFKLYDYITTHFVDYFLFNKKVLLKELALCNTKLMNTNISPEDIEKGEKIVEQMEKDFYNRLYSNKVQNSEDT